MGNVPSTTLTINLGDTSSEQTCMNTVLFQVKEGSILPGANLHFLFYGLEFAALDKYTVLDSSLRPCTFLGNNTVQGVFMTEMTFDGNSREGQLNWPTPHVQYATTPSGIVGVKQDDTLTALFSRNARINPPAIIRKGYCCVEFNNNTLQGIVGSMKVYCDAPVSKEYFSQVQEGPNLFFVVKEGKLVKSFIIDVQKAATEEEVIPDKWYAVNLYIVDADSGVAIPGASVTLGGNKFATSGSAGQVYFHDVAPGTYPLTINKSGYYSSGEDDIDNDYVTIS